MTHEEYEALLPLPCGKEPLFSIYDNMISRCYTPSKGAGYERYGGRGIKVCPEWRASFQAFREWAIPLFEPGLTLDRIDNDGDYTPENCRFATPVEQARNRRNNHKITIGRYTRCLIEWTEIFGLSRKTFYQRIARGMSEIEALTTPPLR